MIVNYYAYGSNMDENRLKKRIGNIISMEMAILENYTLVFNKIASNKKGVGYANILINEPSFVQGILYQIKESDLLKLDRYEGCPLHYERVNIKVITENNIYKDAITYIAAPSATANNLKPSKDYLSHFLVAKKWLSSKYIEYLKSFETIEEEYTVIVYGTLKYGFYNHYILEGLEYQKAFVKGFNMYGGPNFPFATPGNGVIHGEIYVVNEKIFKNLDRLEGYPHLYNRCIVDATIIESNSNKKAVIYYIENITPKLQQIKNGVWN